MTKKRPATLITDFDGTMAQNDFYEVVLEHLVPGELRDIWNDYLAGNRTHFSALSAILSKIRADEAKTRDIALHHMNLDPETGEKVQQLFKARWFTIVVSAGCNWYIRQLLRQQGLHVRERVEDESSWRSNYVRLYTNPSQFIAGSGILMWPNERSPYYEPRTGINKAAIVSEARAAGGTVAFAGDSAIDIDAAMKVEDHLRFATGWLAGHFEERGIPCHRFSRWSEVADTLLEYKTGAEES